MIKKNYIPTINISSILRKNFNSKTSLKIVKEIEKACLDVGFFQITGHGIKLKNINKICKVGENFFKLNIKNNFKFLKVGPELTFYMTRALFFMEDVEKKYFLFLLIFLYITKSTNARTNKLNPYVNGTKTAPIIIIKQPKA